MESVDKDFIAETLVLTLLSVNGKIYPHMQTRVGLEQFAQGIIDKGSRSHRSIVVIDEPAEGFMYHMKYAKRGVPIHLYYDTLAVLQKQIRASAKSGSQFNLVKYRIAGGVVTPVSFTARDPLLESLENHTEALRLAL